AAAPDRIEAVVPMPPALNSQPQRMREAPPVPPPVQESQPITVAPQPVSASPQNTDAGIKSTLDRTIDRTLDRVLGFGDAQISDKLRGIVAGKQLERRIDHVPERKAIESFYAARNYAPIWIGEGRV